MIGLPPCLTPARSTRDAGAREKGGDLPDSHFSVGVRVHKRAAVVTVTGELDLASSQVFEEAMAEALGAGTELVVIELGDLEFIDMSGLRVMLDAHDRIERDGKRLMLVNVGQAMMRLLRITGLTHLFELVDNSGIPDELDEPPEEIWHRKA